MNSNRKKVGVIGAVLKKMNWKNRRGHWVWDEVKFDLTLLIAGAILLWMLNTVQ